MIIDCHGHYTTEPKDLHRFRKEQTAAANAKDKAALPSRASLKMSDDEIRESIEQNQLKLQRERGTDLTIFSPRASGMGHHVGDESISLEWSQICNDLIHRVCTLYPKNFIGVCQLPQSPGVPPKNSAAELERCVKELGFIGCNLNPDPSGGYFNAPPLTDKWWYPFYEKMIELDVPAMIHVSGCCNPAMHTTGSYYLNADTMAFMQLILSDVFKDFPTLKLIIPHGGGAVPFHWGRFRGLALNNGRPSSTRSSRTTSSSTPASITSRASTCSPKWSLSRTFCSLQRWSARSKASIRKPASTSTTPNATSTRRRA